MDEARAFIAAWRSTDRDLALRRYRCPARALPRPPIPALFPPEAAYIRDADAKPQEKFRVARVP